MVRGKNSSIGCIADHLPLQMIKLDGNMLLA